MNRCCRTFYVLILLKLAILCCCQIYDYLIFPKERVKMRSVFVIIILKVWVTLPEPKPGAGWLCSLFIDGFAALLVLQLFYCSIFLPIDLCIFSTTHRSEISFCPRCSLGYKCKTLLQVFLHLDSPSYFRLELSTRLHVLILVQLLK